MIKKKIGDKEKKEIEKLRKKTSRDNQLLTRCRAHNGGNGHFSFNQSSRIVTSIFNINWSVWLPLLPSSPPPSPSSLPNLVINTTWLRLNNEVEHLRGSEQPTGGELRRDVTGCAATAVKLTEGKKLPSIAVKWYSSDVRRDAGGLGRGGGRRSRRNVSCFFLLIN